MATYKSGYKRKGNDKFITYLLVGFAVIILSLVIGLIVNNIVNPELDYDSFDQVTNFQQIHQQDEDEYFVYWYSESCYYCTQIKNQVMGFADSNNADVKVYMMDAANTDGYKQFVIDPATGEPLGGTPAMIAVRNGEIVDIAPGYIEIPNLIDDVNDGSYDYFN